MPVSRTIREVGLISDESSRRISAASLQDLDELERIERASFSAPWSRKMLQAELVGNPFASVFVVRTNEGSGVLGYICYWVMFEELRLMNLAVDPSARRQGVATALVRHGLRDGERRGVKRAVLEVRASNESALALYEGFGFKRTAVRPDYYSNPREDAILMELSPIATQ